jgi:hypothetical protein
LLSLGGIHKVDEREHLTLGKDLALKGIPTISALAVLHKNHPYPGQEMLDIPRIEKMNI